MEEESALSRLITESTPPEALLPFGPGITDETIAPTTVSSGPNRGKASIITTLAGTLICLQWGFTWGAFFTKTGWMDSHLQVSLGWQTKYLPFLDKHVDFVIQETSVFTLASNLKDDKEYFSLAGIWFCSVVIPCVFMIVCPIWILTDYTVPRRKFVPQQQQQLFSRSWLELTVRLSSLVSFIILTLNIAIRGIELSWADTDLQVHNEIRGAYLSYLVGTSCALTTVVILRMPFLEHIQLLKYPYQKENAASTRHARANSNFSAVSAEVPPPRALYSPPPNAFSLPWLSSKHGRNGNSATADPVENESETERLIEPEGTPQQASNPSPTRQSQQSVPTTVPPCKISKNQKIILFQAGVLAPLLCFPALVLAQFRVLYDGLVVDLIKTKAFNVYLWQFPQIIWHTGVQSGTPKWIMVVTFSMICLVVLILPLVAYLVAVLAWMRPRLRPVFRDVLQLLQPTLCGIPLAAAIVVTVPSFIDIGEDLDEDICTQIEKVIQNQCLISGGVRLAGCYFLLAQAIVLEIFVALTIRWTAPPKTSNNTVV